MEKIETFTVRACNILVETEVESVASAVKWLLDQMPLVPGSVFGRISSEEGTSSCMSHPFFKEDLAPVPFANSKVLLNYVLKV